MRVAITGASGFIGRKVVAAAVAAGHEVVAIVRANQAPEWEGQKNIHVRQLDLTAVEGIDAAIEGCDVLIHLAAAMSGSDQYQSTLQSTENVLQALDRAGVKKLIGLSSISVLDYPSCPVNSEVSESTVLNKNDSAMGPYALMKRDQEALFRAWQDEGKDVLVLRPGLVFDESELSDAHVGFKFIGCKHKGEVPVVAVEKVAEACVSGLALSSFGGEIIHLVNNILPSQMQYISALKEKGSLGRIVMLPWPLYNFATALLRFPLNLIGKTPDGLCKNSVHGRQKPLRFSNKKAKDLLAWSAASSLDTH